MEAEAPVDLAARVTRYEEALQTIARGDRSPTTLALLAYAALYNQPPVETAVEEALSALRTRFRLAYDGLVAVIRCHDQGAGCDHCAQLAQDVLRLLKRMPEEV